MSQVLKKPKLENETVEVVEEENNGGSRDRSRNNRIDEEEQKEALTALAEHRCKEVEHIKQKIAYYQTQLEQAERRLNDTLSKLVRLDSHENSSGSKRIVSDGRKNVKVERRSASPVCIGENHSRPHAQSKPQLIIPAVNPKTAQPVTLATNPKISVDFSSRDSVPAAPNAVGKSKGEPSHRHSNELEAAQLQGKGTKRKFEQKEHTELIPLIRSSGVPCTLRCQPSMHISSQHKRKLRSLSLCPSNDQLFATSALDGVVNFWQIQGRGSSASLLGSTDCSSTKQRRWPEDIAWHPQGDSLFCAYTGDAGDSQISILNLNTTQRGKRVTYLEEKPHLKGIINSIIFMPWEDSCFVTGGSDHAVVLWKENDGEASWKPKAVHRNMHSSAVMGVAGLQQKQIVISVGADKRIIGYDLLAGRADYKYQIESKCMSVVPNPSDFNLFMVQTGAHERQLRLFDIRLRQTEIHAFGWKQESSESQSALVNQAWSPDGLYITSGSADPTIHIFDIRYNSHKPSQSLKAHQKRVFKAVWLRSLPLLVSISSDLQIGVHKVS